MAEGGNSTLDTDLKHILSTEMSQMEIQWGFSLFQSPSYDQGKAQTYVGFVQPDAFRAQVKLGRHWKDPGVPGKHGEYTHRIQWYLLAQNLKEVLGEKPVELFKEIGGIINSAQPNSGLWDALFDRDKPSATNVPFKIASNVSDCRSPESFTEFIINDENEEAFPFLHWFIKARLKKREDNALNNFGAAKQYVEKKLKKYGLNETEASAIIGTYRTFGKDRAPSPILQPGVPIVPD